MTESDSVLTERPALPSSFDGLAESRRQWIDTILHPWCLSASLKDLRHLESEWVDLAGRVDVNATLWTWAWERFAGLTHPEMAGVNETHEVRVVLADGNTVSGFPDSRLSVRGVLVIIGTDGNGDSAAQFEPIPIDDLVSVEVVTG